MCMKCRLYCMLLLLSLTTAAAAEELGVCNRHPIVLVGGFMNFGRDEGLGFRYWGGTDDIQLYLEEHGYTVYTADVGPLSSNRDRACELFAEIAGGRVDYGAGHAEQYGHERFGKIHTGFYPKWGSVDPATGEIRKVHLVCHSMGGQTARVLARLLEEGAPEELEKSGKDTSALFIGGRTWIESITTIATPHNGTTLTRTATYVEELAVFFLAMLEAANNLIEGRFFDFRLDHWGLGIESGEDFGDIRDKLLASRLWEKTEDFSLYDLTPEGAAALNRRTPACEDIYYFSWAAEKTAYDCSTGEVYPEAGLNPRLLPGALFIANYSPRGDDPGWIDWNWRVNDGVVNTVSMRGPVAGSKDGIIPFDGRPRRGVWNDMGILSSCDHLDVIGISAVSLGPTIEGYPSVEEWYLDLARFLWSLE